MRNKNRKPEEISKYIIKRILTTVLILLILVTLTEIITYSLRFMEESSQLRSSYVENRKARIRAEVEQARSILKRLREIYPENKKALAMKHAAIILENLNWPDVGYLFSSTYEGITIFGPNKGKNGLEITDVNGKKVVRELIITAKAGGGYLEYVMPPIDGKRSAPKISYVLPVPEWGWYIGAGVYLDEINTEIAKKQSAMIQDLLRGILINILIALFFTILLLLANRRMEQKLEKVITGFNNFFINTVDGKDKMDTINIPFAEFTTLAIGANAMLEKRITMENALRESEANYKHMAFHDSLTDLPNRIYYKDYLEKRIQENNKNFKFGVIYIDLDNFKDVNSFMGQETGDRILYEAGRRFLEINDCDKVVARINGDEFAMVFPFELTPELLAELIKQVQSSLNIPFTVNNSVFNITSSIGIALYPEHGNTPLELLKNAELAMNQVKKQGKNGVLVYNNSLYDHIHQKIWIANRLREAYEREWFVVYYQPQVDLNNGEIIGLEALLRWNDPERGIISPKDFIPVAEESGHIKAIGQWVFQKACRFAKSINEGRKDKIVISINFSPKQIMGLEIVDVIKEGLKKTGVPPECIAIEITESSIIDSVEECVQKLKGIEKLGVKTYLDDFGTGYSAMNLLRQLPLDGIKVDRSFIMGMETDGKMQRILSNIIGIAETLDLQIIAEGIEKPEQNNILKEMGCGIGQGFLYYKPMPEDDVKKLIL